MPRKTNTREKQPAKNNPAKKNPRRTNPRTKPARKKREKQTRETKAAIKTLSNKCIEPEGTPHLAARFLSRLCLLRQEELRSALGEARCSLRRQISEYRRNFGNYALHSIGFGRGRVFGKATSASAAGSSYGEACEAAYGELSAAGFSTSAASEAAYGELSARKHQRAPGDVQGHAGFGPAGKGRPASGPASGPAGKGRPASGPAGKGRPGSGPAGKGPPG